MWDSPTVWDSWQVCSTNPSTFQNGKFFRTAHNTRTRDVSLIVCIQIGQKQNKKKKKKRKKKKTVALPSSKILENLAAFSTFIFSKKVKKTQSDKNWVHSWLIFFFFNFTFGDLSVAEGNTIFLLGPTSPHWHHCPLEINQIGTAATR